MTRKLYRQGDVILERIDLSNDTVKRFCNTISNKLEIPSETGHRHLLEAEVCRDGASQIYVIVHKNTKMVHDQHPALEIEPGIYVLRFVRDWLLESARAVD